MIYKLNEPYHQCIYICIEMRFLFFEKLYKPNIRFFFPESIRVGKWKLFQVLYVYVPLKINKGLDGKMTP